MPKVFSNQSDSHGARSELQAAHVKLGELAVAIVFGPGTKPIGILRQFIPSAPVQNRAGAIKMANIEVSPRSIGALTGPNRYSMVLQPVCDAAGAIFLLASGSAYMVTISARRRVCFAILTILIVYSAAWLVALPASAQAPIAPAAPAPTEPVQQITDWLLKDAVSEGTANSPQYKDIADAVTRFTNGKLDEARDLLNDAVKKNPKLPPAEVMMGRLISLRQGAAQAARAELEKAILANPSDPDAYLFFAEAALQERRVADADALLMEVKPLVEKFNSNPKRKRNFEIRFDSLMAAVAEAREQWDLAAQYLKALQALEPENPLNAQSHLRLGRVMFKQGKSRVDVYYELEKATKSDPKSIDPYIYLAILNEEEKKHAEAKDIIAQAVSKHGTDINVLLAAAKWALNTGEKDAQAYADAALKLDPKSVEAKIIRGEVARFASPPDLKKAREMFESVVSQSPANLEASNQLALTLIESNDPNDQKRALDYAKVNAGLTTRGNQFSPEVLATYAWTLFKTGQLAEAEQVLNQLLQTRQLSPDTVYYIGRILQERGKTDEAIQFLEAGLQVPTPFAQRDAATKLLVELKKEKDREDRDSKKGTQPTSSSNGSGKKK